MPDLDLSGSIDRKVENLIRRLNSTFSFYRIKYLLNDFNIPTFGMYIEAKLGSITGYSHAVCSHLNKAIALSRTITEAIQVFPKFKTGKYWLNKKTDHYIKTSRTVSFKDIIEYNNPDIKKNIKYCVELLNKQNLETFVVNQSIPGLKCSVVRVLIAGLQPIWFKETPYLVDRVFTTPKKLGFKEKKKINLNYGQFAGFPYSLK